MLKRLPAFGWIYYIDTEKESSLKNDKVGKWMHFFNNREFADRICKTAVETGVVAEAKYRDAPIGVCCFYLNGDDFEGHKRCIDFFLKNDLIRKTKTGRLYNVSFKYDTQTLSGQYGSDFKSDIRLADFVDLNTSEWLT